jgi:hypothetical protein
VTIAPNDHRFVITSGSGSAAEVFRSTDRGKTWAKTESPPPGQVQPTIDTDIVSFPSGRILGSELDTAGLNFPGGFSDDEGKTWTASHGSNMLADQDRQWYAVGPNNHVYLLYHNLASGFASHNMWVSTSTDGGATFGPPVPTTLPGSDAWSDLQCADSGGPSSIAVNQKTGRIYVFFTTRGAPVGGVDTGGCGSRPIEVNIVSGTRVWVATSPDGSPGTWTDSLAVDDSATGQVVSMQLAYGTLDNQGNPWVAYPETPKPYPNLAGAAVKVVHSDPDLKSWSKPVTLVPAGGPGSLLVHLVVGDPGKLDVAYFKGEGPEDKPGWYLHVVQTLDALDPNPTVTDTKVADFASYAEPAELMMGACSGDPDQNPAAGIENGFTCDRSTDVWGVAMDADCNLTVTWPGRNNDISGDAGGTYVTTQNGGSRVCGADTPASGGSGNPQGQFCHDVSAPQVTRKRGDINARRRRIVLHGKATDRGCVNNVPNQPVKGTIRAVKVAVARQVGAKCAFISARGRLGRPTACARPRFLTAHGTNAWSLTLKGRFPRGTYRMYVRGIDRQGNVTPIRRPVRFRVR